VQSRGKWMIPAYKAVLYTSFGCSMYMMGRLVLVRRVCPHADNVVNPSRGTRRGSARTEYLDRVAMDSRRAWGGRMTDALYKQPTSRQTVRFLMSTDVNKYR
jgi:hypothetical protein